MFPQWLNEEKIIQRLVEIVHPSQDEDVRNLFDNSYFVLYTNLLLFCLQSLNFLHYILNYNITLK